MYSFKIFLVISLYPYIWKTVTPQIKIKALFLTDLFTMYGEIITQVYDVTILFFFKT